MPDTFQDPSTEEGFQDETVDITNAPSPKPLDLAISSKVWSDLSAPEIFLEPSPEEGHRGEELDITDPLPSPPIDVDVSSGTSSDPPPEYEDTRRSKWRDMIKRRYLT